MTSEHWFSAAMSESADVDNGARRGQGMWFLNTLIDLVFGSFRYAELALDEGIYSLFSNDLCDPMVVTVPS